MKRTASGWVVVAVAAAAGLGLAGCSKGGSSSPALGDRAIKAVDVAARAGSFHSPLDAAPSPDGSTIYFTGAGANGPAVFRVVGTGGAVATLAQGAPLAQPTGIAVATDGSRIFVADPQAGSGGAVLTLAATGTPSTPTVVSGTQGRSPRGLDVINQGGADVIYFTGTDPANGEVGVFQVAASGGAVRTVAEGTPFVSPDSVVVAASGTAYVTDQGSSADHGEVWRVAGGKAESVLTGLDLGRPAGVTLVDNDATLLVSSVNDSSHSDQVLFLDLATGKTAVASKVIGSNKNSSGGLHRAHNAAAVAWADTQGTIYRVRFPAF
jgi:sugar lactone lactonase YvrE